MPAETAPLPLLAFHEFKTADMMQVHWSAPTPGKPVRGIVLLLHGCMRVGLDWFRLPEDRAITEYLLGRGFIVFAPTSSHECWSGYWPPKGNEDFDRLQDALAVFHSTHYTKATGASNSAGLPYFAIGASSGGSFTSLLSRGLPLRACVVQISPGEPDAINAPADPATGILPSPPTAFLYMTRDRMWATKEAAVRSAHALNSRQSEAITLECSPKPLTPDTLSTAMAMLNVSKTVSEAFYQAVRRLRSALDDKGFLVANPRASQLASAVLRDPANASWATGLNEEAVGEILNVLYSEHEITREHLPEITVWFESKLTTTATA